MHNITTVSTDIKVGDVVEFGHYRQSHKNEEKTPIEWIVLKVEDNKMLLLSKYGIDAIPFNKDWEDGNVWERSNIRKWLDEDFAENAFSKDEMNCILPYNTGKYEDKIFLLSAEEYQNLSDSVWNEIRFCIRTRYTISLDDVRTQYWWLRTPGTFSYRAAGVGMTGRISLMGELVNYPSVVRPAVWVSKDVLNEK